jgi:S1-C subfamily serine protease
MVRAACVAGFALMALAASARQEAEAAGPSADSSPTITSNPAGTETINVPYSKADPGEAGSVASSQSTTAQIPQALPTDPYAGTADSSSGDPIVNYENAQNGNPYGSGYGPPVGSAQDFLNQGEDDVSPLGIRLRPDRRRLKSGEVAEGLLVLSVTSGGPAAKAGVKPYRHTARTTLEVASVAGAFFFPPAMFLLPVLESTELGDSYDMIIGVDGFRVTSALDFEDCMRDVQPGEIVYLSVVRNGQRVQVPVTVPNLPQ